LPLPSEVQARALLAPKPYATFHGL